MYNKSNHYKFNGILLSILSTRHVIWPEWNFYQEYDLCTRDNFAYRTPAKLQNIMLPALPCASRAELADQIHCCALQSCWHGGAVRACSSYMINRSATRTATLQSTVLLAGRLSVHAAAWITAAAPLHRWSLVGGTYSDPHVYVDIKIRH